MKIDIKVTEVLSRIVSVEAKSVEEAIKLVEEMYNKERLFYIKLIFFLSLKQLNCCTKIFINTYG
jgi:hypothetical protein